MYNHKDGVVLRKIERSDLQYLLNLKKESWWGTHSTQIINLDDQNYWFDNIPKNQLFLIGEVECERIGVASLTNIDTTNGSLNISGSVFKNYRSKWAFPSFCAGLDFAFEMFNVHRVEAEVLEYHVTAQKLEIEKLGFVVEGKKRKSVFKCGNYYDSIILGMLREDWLKSERVKQYGDSCNLNFSPNRFKKLSNYFSRKLP